MRLLPLFRTSLPGAVLVNLSSRVTSHGDRLEQFRTTPMEVPQFPVHGQAIERFVKEVTAAAEQVFGYERRDGFIRACMAHREVMLSFVSKKDLISVGDRE